MNWSERYAKEGERICQFCGINPTNIVHLDSESRSYAHVCPECLTSLNKGIHPHDDDDDDDLPIFLREGYEEDNERD